MKRVLISIFIVAFIVIGIVLYKTLSKANIENALPTIKVQRADLVDKALAIGTIEPENEISIKSKVSGVVERIFIDIGSQVKSGERLIEIRPDPTPLELADAKRQVELQQVEMENLRKERVRQESLIEKDLISIREFEDFERRYQGAELQLNIANEKLALIESGKVTIGDTEIETIIKAPISGFLLSKYVEVGDPVTPLTSYQEGTVLMRIANMDNLIFRGTVDEIDVGRLEVGMEVDVTIGALPDKKVGGVLQMISLKAEKRDNATVFPIEILVNRTEDVTLRAGYSANADIIIEKRDSVLVIPERIITFRNDSAFVKVALPGNEEERYIETGLSDAINIQVLAGLAEGDSINEKPIKEIE